MAELTIATGDVTDWDPRANDAVSALACVGTNLYVGGELSAVGCLRRHSLVLLDGLTGEAKPWDPYPLKLPGHGLEYATDLAIGGETLFVAGSFDSIGGESHTNLAAVDMKSGLALPGWRCDFDYLSQLRTLALSPDKQTLYVGGSFSQADGSARKCLAAVRAASGQLLAWNPNAMADDPVVLDVLPSPDGTRVYAAGWFTNVGGEARCNLAALDPTTGRATAWDPHPDGSVYALAFSPDAGTLYVGGVFGNIAGQARNSLAAFDTQTGTLKPWAPFVYGDIYTMGVSTSGVVYVGGRFYTLAGQSRYSLGAVDGTSGVATDWDPLANENAFVVVPCGGAVFAGGDWTQIYLQGRTGFAQFGEIGLGADSDGDGLPDAWERQHFGDLSHNGTSDWDHDGLTDAQELPLGTDPCNPDSDGDKAKDGDEVAAGTNPTNACSFLAISGIHVGSNRVTIDWHGGCAATQFLQSCACLATDETWSTLFTNRPPTPIATNAMDPAVLVGPRFYRVRAGR